MKKELESQILNLLYNKASWEFKLTKDLSILKIVDKDTMHDNNRTTDTCRVEDFCLRDEGRVLEELVDLIRDTQEKKTTEELDKLERLLKKHDKIIQNVNYTMKGLKKAIDLFKDSAPMIEILGNQRILKERFRQLKEGLVGT